MNIQLTKIMGFITYMFAITVISTAMIRLAKSLTTLSGSNELLLLSAVIFFVTFICTVIARQLGLFKESG